MDVNEEADIKSYCWKNGVEIYPVEERGVWYIQAKTQKKRHTYKQKMLHRGPVLRMTPEIQERIMNAYRHWHKKLKGNV